MDRRPSRHRAQSVQYTTFQQLVSGILTTTEKLITTSRKLECEPLVTFTEEGAFTVVMAALTDFTPRLRSY